MNLKPFLMYLGLPAYEPYLDKEEITLIETISAVMDEQESATKASVTYQFLNSMLHTLKPNDPEIVPLSKGMQSLIGYLCLITNQYDLVNGLVTLGYEAVLPWKLIIYYHNYGMYEFSYDLYERALNNSDSYIEDDIMYMKSIFSPLISSENYEEIQDKEKQDFFWEKMFNVKYPLPSVFLALFNSLFYLFLNAELVPNSMNDGSNLLFSAIIRAQELENYYVLGRLLQVLGTYHINMGHFQDALEAQQESYNLLLDSGDDRSAMAVFANLASTYFNNGDLENAVIVEKIAVEYYRKKGVRANMFYTIASLIKFLLLDGEIEEAKEYLQLLNNFDASIFLGYTINEMITFFYSINQLREEKLVEFIITRLTMDMEASTLISTEQQARLKLAQMLLIIFHELNYGNLGNAEDVLNQITLMKQHLKLRVPEIALHKIQTLILLKRLLIDNDPKIIQDIEDRISLMIDEATSSPSENVLLPPLLTIKEALRALVNKEEIPPLFLGNFTRESPLPILENGNEFISHFNEIPFYSDNDESLVLMEKTKLIETYFIREVFMKPIFAKRDPIIIKNSLLSILIIGTGGITLYQHIIDHPNMSDEHEHDGNPEKHSYNIPHDLLANFYNVISLKYSSILQQEENRFQKIFRLQDYSVILRPCHEKNYFVVGIMRTVGIKELSTLKFITTKIDNDPNLPNELFYSNKEISEQLKKIIEECIAIAT